MKDRGSEKPNTRRQWMKFKNTLAVGKDLYLYPNSIESVSVRSLSPVMRVRIQTTGGRIVLEGTEAEQLIQWLERMAGFVIEADL